MKEKTVWFGEKHGIRFEINRFEYYDKSSYDFGWTYYLYLSPQQFPENVRDQIKTKTYYTAFGTRIEICRTEINDLDWHGGLTWSSNETKQDSNTELYKFGCDFQHRWDEYKSYSLQDVESEVDVTIDSLFKKWPEIISLNEVHKKFSEKFPGANAGEDRFFDINGKPMEML